MMARWWIILSSGLLLLAGCHEQRGGPEEKGEAVSDEPAVATWQTQAWPMTRGGKELQGRVEDAVPDRPKVFWTFAMEGPGTAEAAVVDGTVLVGDATGNMYALDLATGKERWRSATGGSIQAAPAVTSKMVLVGSTDGKFYAFDLQTGEERWHFEGADKFTAGGIVLKGPDGKEEWVLVNCYDGTAHCLRVEDGSEVWHYQTGNYLNSSSALVDEELVVFGGCDAMIHAIHFADGSSAHEIETEAQITNSGATWGGVMYCGNHGSQVVAAEVKSEKVLWIYEGDDFPFVVAPAVDADHVYIGARDKNLHAINRITGESVWKFRTGGRVESAPLVFADAVVFGSNDGRLYAVDAKAGTEKWRVDVGEGLTAAPAFASGRIVIAGDEGTVFVLAEE